MPPSAIIFNAQLSQPEQQYTKNQQQQDIKQFIGHARVHNTTQNNKDSKHKTNWRTFTHPEIKVSLANL